MISDSEDEKEIQMRSMDERSPDHEASSTGSLPFTSVDMTAHCSAEVHVNLLVCHASWKNVFMLLVHIACSGLKERLKIVKEVIRRVPTLRPHFSKTGVLISPQQCQLTADALCMKMPQGFRITLMKLSTASIHYVPRRFPRFFVPIRGTVVPSIVIEPYNRLGIARFAMRTHSC